MSRIFLSHSSANSAEAIAVRDWMKDCGWDDVFLDLDPERGLVAGERWQAALTAAVDYCELVMFLVSPEWAASTWCKAEFLLTKHGRNPKAIIPVLVAPTPFSILPGEMVMEYQSVDLTAGERMVTFNVVIPTVNKTAVVSYSAQGLERLKIAIERAGIDARHFDWPPKNESARSPYRGLKPLEAEDAGIFFGRDAPIVRGLDKLRALREDKPSRTLVILGASGAGKSSFLRAGLYPRLKRDNQHFLPLPVVRPGHAPLYGETGFLMALVEAFQWAQIAMPKAELRAAIESGAGKVKHLLTLLVNKMTPAYLENAHGHKPPTVVVAIDQTEELFLADAQSEAKPLLSLLKSLTDDDAPAVIVLFTIRSDSYEHLQEASELTGMQKFPFDLGPMPKGSYAEVIKGPLQRLEGTSRAIAIEEPLVDALLSDIEDGDTKDALPLLAFTLERLYLEYHAGRQLCLKHYDKLGRVKGSIEAAVECTLQAADGHRELPSGRKERLALLRKAFIPWLAGIDPETGNALRRVARFKEIPKDAIPMIDLLVEERLLSVDVAKDTKEKTIEPAHEALLRKWSLLKEWLHEDAALLSALHGITRASKDWSESRKSSSWLVHGGGRLRIAEQILNRSDLAASLTSADRDYISACQAAEHQAHAVRTLLKALLVAVVLIGVAWWKQDYIQDQYRWYTKVKPHFQQHFKPYVPTPDQKKDLPTLGTFRECSKDTHCPTMIVVPAGDFDMGTSDSEVEALRAKYPHRDGLAEEERPQRKVHIPAFAIARYELTFDEWDVCVQFGDCPQRNSPRWGKGQRPVMNISWDEAQRYISWLSKATGTSYRLPSEAEWEYAARAGSKTQYSWGDDPEQGRANCSGCNGKQNGKTEPVGSYSANAFGLHDMHGNVREWVEDIYHDNYLGTPPANGAAWLDKGNIDERVIRGGAWFMHPEFGRSANRAKLPPETRNNFLGFRVAKTLDHYNLVSAVPSSE